MAGVVLANLLEQPLLMRDWLQPFEREMSTARSESWSLVESVALLVAPIVKPLRS